MAHMARTCGRRMSHGIPPPELPPPGQEPPPSHTLGFAAAAAPPCRRCTAGCEYGPKAPTCAAANTALLPLFPPNACCEAKEWPVAPAIVEGGGKVLWRLAAPVRPIFSISRSCAASCVARAATCIHDALVMVRPPPQLPPPPRANISASIDENVSSCCVLPGLVAAFEFLLITMNILSLN